jgi:uncharacterized protein (TIGR03067 family)
MLTALLLLAAHVQNAKKPEPKEASIEGAWTVLIVKMQTTGGKEVIFADDAGKTASIDKTTIVVPGLMREPYFLKAGDPKQVNLHNAKDGKALVGIYQVKGEQLTMVWSRKEGVGRPKNFDWPASAGVAMMYMVLDRKKAK